MFINGFFVLDLIKFKHLYKFNMKSKIFLVSFIALLAMVFALSTVIAQVADAVSVEVKGSTASSTTPISVGPSETVTVRVDFTAINNASRVKVKVYIEGFDEISEETDFFRVTNGTSYPKTFSLKMPSTSDFDGPTKNVNLYVRVIDDDQPSFEEFFPLKVEKESSSLNVLSLDLAEVVVVGNQVAIDVVVENNGQDRLDDVFVKASIPSLGISKTEHIGDLESVQDENDDDIDDSASKTVYLTVPKNTVPGNYELIVEAFDNDASETVVSRVIVQGVNTSVLTGVTSQTVAPGGETTFDLILVNPSNQMVVYTITPGESPKIVVDATEPVVVVSPESSKTVKVRVKATSDLEEGTYVVSVNANSETGLSKQVSYSVKVEKTSSSGIIGEKTDTTVILTVVLVIIFVVLLIILIVLLSKRPAETEEFGETNYY